VTVPQRLTYLTLGARDMSRLRAFYTGLGWHERDGSTEKFTTYQVGPLVLALYPLELLGAEAAPDEPAPSAQWNGVTLGLNVDSADAVDETFGVAVGAGARAVASPVRREWGGYSGYLADPEGNRWEITWAPGA
jgi:hypothetical protein